MDENESESQFFQLVIGLQSSAWMLLGKIQNPMTGEIERNLDGAKATIDVLEMLKLKTKGNLKKHEEEVLNTAVSQLQVNYVAEVEKENTKPIEVPKTDELKTDSNEPETDIKWDKK